MGLQFADRRDALTTFCCCTPAWSSGRARACAARDAWVGKEYADGCVVAARLASTVRRIRCIRSAVGYIPRHAETRRTEEPVDRGHSPLRAAGVLGPEFPKTRKGTVAHFAPRTRRRRAPPRTGACPAPSSCRSGKLAARLVSSRWRRTWYSRRWPSTPSTTAVLGAVGFKAAVRLVRQCPAWQLVYSDLDDALATIEAAWPQVIERHKAVLP